MSDLGEVVQEIEKEMIIKENRIFSVVKSFYVLLGFIDLGALYYFIVIKQGLTLETLSYIGLLSVSLIFIPLLAAITEELMISHYLKKSSNEGK